MAVNTIQVTKYTVDGLEALAPFDTLDEALIAARVEKWREELARFFAMRVSGVDDCDGSAHQIAESLLEKNWKEFFRLMQRIDSHVIEVKS